LLPFPQTYTDFLPPFINGHAGDATSKSVNATRARKRVEADTASTSLKRAKMATLNDPIVKKATEKKKPSTGKEQSVKKVRKQKDPNNKAANPDNKKVSVVAKEGGEKWRSMTEEVSSKFLEKKPYTERATELKEDYLNALQTPIDAEKCLSKKNFEAENEKAVRRESNDDDDGDKVEVVANEEGSLDEVEVVADDE
ncbi:High mobility group (HMG) box domain-containing protein, partial [Cynara cardunculus var. scolymus]